MNQEKLSAILIGIITGLFYLTLTLLNTRTYSFPWYITLSTSLFIGGLILIISEGKKGIVLKSMISISTTAVIAVPVYIFIALN